MQNFEQTQNEIDAYINALQASLQHTLNLQSVRGSEAERDVYQHERDQCIQVCCMMCVCLFFVFAGISLLCLFDYPGWREGAPRIDFLRVANSSLCRRAERAPLAQCRYSKSGSNFFIFYFQIFCLLNFVD
jgi:hypothetical protein